MQGECRKNEPFVLKILGSPKLLGASRFHLAIVCERQRMVSVSKTNGRRTVDERYAYGKRFWTIHQFFKRFTFANR